VRATFCLSHRRRHHHLSTFQSSSVLRPRPLPVRPQLRLTPASFPSLCSTHLCPPVMASRLRLSAFAPALRRVAHRHAHGVARRQFSSSTHGVSNSGDTPWIVCSSYFILFFTGLIQSGLAAGRLGLHLSSSQRSVFPYWLRVTSPFPKTLILCSLDDIFDVTFCAL